MAKTATKTSSGSKRAAASGGVSGGKRTGSPEEAAPAIEPPKLTEAPFQARLTKQDRMLALLSQPKGASVPEMMLATNWQQHSVRGFLAGTVKRKLGFVVKSVKAEGDARRYHIEKPRGR
jgi:hypothetical protein